MTAHPSSDRDTTHAPSWSPVHSAATIGDLTLRVLRRYPDRTAFSSATGSLTYRAAADLIGRFQRSFAARGLRRGDRIALLAGNRAEAWCACIAVQASGMTPSWLHPMGSLPDHLFQLADLDAAACIVDASGHSERAAELADRCGDVRVFGLGASTAAPDLLAEAYTMGVGAAQDLATIDDIAMINYTGGTTGQPKGVVRRHHSHTYQAFFGTLADFEIPYGARYLAAAPITHVAGTKVLPVLARGGTIYLNDGFDAGHILKTIAQERITMSLMVPTMIYGLLDHPDLERADLTSLELLLYGASPMSPHRLREGFARIGPVFSQLYGQTECYPIAVLGRDDHADATLEGACGVPVSTVQTILLHRDGRPAPPGETGEICVRGAAVMDEYWRRPDLTAEAFADGWLHTGDLAHSDDRGYLTIVDRTKDMIISGGFNVYPREVEDALTGHPAVSAAAVFGVADDKWGESVTAAVVLRPHSTVTSNELIAHVRAVKGALHSPKDIRIVDVLPMTAVGKIDKRRLRTNWTPIRS